MPLVNKIFFLLLLFGFSVGAKAQSLEFKGKVVDLDSGLPLEGVTVSIPLPASGYIPRRSSGAPCSLGSPPCGMECSCYAFCVQYLSNDQINIFADQFTDGNEIVQPVFYSPIYRIGGSFHTSESVLHQPVGL